jgi:hypothetical protein
MLNTVLFVTIIAGRNEADHTPILRVIAPMQSSLVLALSLLTSENRAVAGVQWRVLPYCSLFRHA